MSMSSAAVHTSSMSAHVVCCGAVLIAKRMGSTLTTVTRVHAMASATLAGGFRAHMGWAFAAVGVVASRGVKYMSLDKILASTRSLHAAEGAVYQDALRGAAADLGLPCVTVGFPQAENHERWSEVSALGKRVGPPWKKD